MLTVAALGYLTGAILVGGFAGIVFWRIFTRRISLGGLLQGDSRNASGTSTSFSPGRAQMLTITLLLAGYFLAQLIGNPSAFPHIPDAALGVLGASQATYLGGKAYALLFKNR